MTTSNEFSGYYKTISNTELIAILENPDDYQPLAVEAAKKEFLERGLSDTDLSIAKEPLVAKKIKKEKREKMVKEFEDKVNKIGYSLIDSLNPIQPGIPSTEKTIRIIVLVFGGIFLYQLLSDFRTHILYIRDFPGFPLMSTIYFLPLLLLSIGTFAFWKRKTIGWVLLTAFLTFSLVGVLWLMINALFWKPSGLPVLDNLLPRPTLTQLIIQLFFFSGSLYVLGKPNIREVFAISKQRMLSVLILTGSISLFLLYII